MDKVQVTYDSRDPREILVLSPHGRITIDFGRNVGINEAELIHSVLNMGGKIHAAKIRDAQKVVEDLIGESSYPRVTS